MSSQQIKVEEFVKLSRDVIGTTHPIMIRYHRFQDDYRDEPLPIGSYCYIVFNDKRHEPYLVSAIIRKVDKKHMQYTLQRTNDNQIETYRWHQIVVTYNKDLHCVNIEQHKQSIHASKIIKIKSPKNNKNKRKRKRDENENTANIEPNENNKRRKLNDLSAESTHNRPDRGLLSIAQPYFPIPHPYFRQNALLKWKGNDYREYQDRKEPNLLNPVNDWEVGRIVDFDVEKDIVYIQNTYRCGTKDEEDKELLQVNWTQFAKKTCAQFIEHLYLFQLKQPVYYWWDRPGCGSVCNDTVQSLDYGADNDLLYGITGGTKKKLKCYNEENLKWVHKDGLFQTTARNKTLMSKYISRSYPIEGGFSSHSTNKVKKLYDVVVVGAGMAGLTTRWALHNTHKYTLKILEAQDYIGGRLKPHTFPAKTVCDPNKNTYNVPELSVELGAAFLSGSGKDNRFWTWLQRKQRHICTDWGGYNNGWWNGESFIDSQLGAFVSPIIIERIKNICDDIQILCCKLLMPLCDMSVVAGLQYLGVRIPSEQLFGKEDVANRGEVERYFYDVYEKYKILSANWVGPQGLWQQQQTVELQNLDFEALYRFLKAVFKSNKRGKKWLVATEKLIMDYYGDKTNIKTQNFDVYAEQKQYEEEQMDFNNDTVVVINGKQENDADGAEDSEATESENDHSVTLSPLLSPIKIPNNPINWESKVSPHVNWAEIVKYDVSDYHGAAYHYKFGFRDVLVRDIIHPPHEEEASEFEKTTGLSSMEYERFKNALQHLADCNIFSYHLFFLRCDAKWRHHPKAQQLLDRFKDDLELFDTAIEDFQKILSGKVLDENIHKPQVYHTNRKTKMFQANKEKVIQSNGQQHVHKKNIEKEQLFATLPKFDTVIQDVIIQNMQSQKQLENPHENISYNDKNDTLTKRKRREHKKHKKHRKHKKKHKKKESEYDSIDNRIEQEFKQYLFDENLSLNPDAATVGDGFVPNGYSQVLAPFAVDTTDKNTISLNQQVTSIERIHNDKFGDLSEIRGIDLKTSKPFTYWSRFVSVAVPLGVLKLSLNSAKENNHSGIKFKPPLSAEKIEAITAMGMGCENKVYLRFTKCFWPRDKPYFQSIQHPEYRFINLSYEGFELPRNTNVLCTMIPPMMGKKWYWQHPAQELRIVWDVLRVLKQMFKVREKKASEEMKGNDVVMSDKAEVNMEINNSVNGEDMEVKVNEMDDIAMNGHVMGMGEEKQRECKLLNSTEEIAELLQMLVDYKVTDWEHNIFTRGSYSYLPKGAIYTHCKALQKYDGDGIYFCGEATSIEGFECVDGAHETGFNVAKQIHKQLQKQRFQRKNRASRH